MSRRTFTCPDCGLEVSLTKKTARVRKKKSAARAAAARRNLAEGRVIIVDGKFARGPNAGTPKRSEGTSRPRRRRVAVREGAGGARPPSRKRFKGKEREL